MGGYLYVSNWEHLNLPWNRDFALWNHCQYRRGKEEKQQVD